MLHLRFARTRKPFATMLVLVLVCAAFFSLPVSALNPSPVKATTAEPQDPPQVPPIPPGQAYRQVNLASDLAGAGLFEDPALINPWGISMTSTSPFWVANAGTSTSRLYRGDVGGSPLVPNTGLNLVNIPGGLPTGTVANTTANFQIAVPCGQGCTTTSPARFIFASISGNITAWHPNLGNSAVIAASHPGHVYTGLAIGSNGIQNLLYAADIANGKIDVYDTLFNLVQTSGTFTDPNLPAGFSPHNIQNLGGILYVAYARPIGPAVNDETLGAGIVSKFDGNGNFLGRVATGGTLTSPWGMVIAPSNFGIFSNALLVGNFVLENEELGFISAFNPTTGQFLGVLQNESGAPLVNEGLWGLVFGNGANGGDPNALYFAAGIGDEGHGIFGSIRPTTATATSLVQFAAEFSLDDNEFIIDEGAGHVDVAVTRTGDVSGTGTVYVTTFDERGPGHASQKSDYEIAVSKLTFNPGETVKTVRVLIVDDNRQETDEEINLILSNAGGAGTGLGTPHTVEVVIRDNDATNGTTNPIENAQFFVRQQYLDFLNREPDAAGLQFWTNEITSCGNNQQCIAQKRVQVSAAFFLSIEFQRSGFLAYTANRAAFGDMPLYGTFMLGTQTLQRNLVFGTPNFDAQLEANKQEFFNDFVQRPEFRARYESLSNADFVDRLMTTAGIDPANQRLFVVNMTNSQEVPPANPPNRPASSGTARFLFNQAMTSLTLTATVNNIDFTGSQTTDTSDNLTNAHIHASATASPTTTAPVVWGFIGAPFNDNNPNDARVTPFTSGVGGTVSAKWDAPEGNNTTLAAQLSNLREGRAYVNFHTTQFPGGEIRGNFPAATTFRNELLAGLNAGTLTRAGVLRRIAESEEIRLREFNTAFVLMEYFGYLRRNPQDPPDNSLAGFNFWLGKLNSFNGDFVASEMVKAFITSAEYRQRFGAS